jgi:hypothetical protein
VATGGDRKSEEPVRATIVAWASPVGLGVVYETSNGAKPARPISAKDWPVIDRLHYGGRLVLARLELRYRYFDAARESQKRVHGVGRVGGMRAEHRKRIVISIWIDGLPLRHPSPLRRHAFCTGRSQATGLIIDNQIGTVSADVFRRPQVGAMTHVC